MRVGRVASLALAVVCDDPRGLSWAVIHDRSQCHNFPAPEFFFFISVGHFTASWSIAHWVAPELSNKTRLVIDVCAVVSPETVQSRSSSQAGSKHTFPVQSVRQHATYM